MRRTFGKASDFYHARLITLEENGLEEVEWRQDILYRSPEAAQESTTTSYNLEVVNIDNRKNYLIETFEDKILAEEELKKMQDDVATLSKRELEDKYNFFDLNDF